MGIGVVLIVYFIALSILAVGCALVLVFATRRYLREVTADRRRMTVYAALLPFACVAYAGCWFITYSVLNDVAFHHDPGIGDGWYTDIGNGYAIDMIDVIDQGSVHPIDGPDRGLNSPNGISGVRRLQVTGNYIFGSEDRNWFGNLGSNTKNENSFFAINTRTRSKTEFATEAQLASFARQTGDNLAMKPIAEVYDRYRYIWFDAFAAAILFLVPALALSWLVWCVIRLKRGHLSAVMANQSTAE